jgi:hypothetical protein
MMTRYRSCPRLQHRSCPPSSDRLELLEQSVMNSRSLKWMVDVLSKLDAEQKMGVAGGDGEFTYMREPSKHLEEKHAANPPSWRANCLCFLLARYRVVKIARSYSKVVVRTTKHTIVYPGSGPSLEVIALRPAV